MIFERAGTSLDPYVSSIMLAVSLLLGALLTTYLADILGEFWKSHTIFFSSKIISYLSIFRAEITEPDFIGGIICRIVRFIIVSLS